MIYTDSHRWRNTLVVMIILCSATFGSLWYAGKLSLITDFSFLKGQVLTPLSLTDLDYLQRNTGYTPIDTTKTLEDLIQHMIERLLTASSTDFDKTNNRAAQNYLITYYRFSQPIPTTITQALQTSADRFRKFSGGGGGGGGGGTGSGGTGGTIPTISQATTPSITHGRVAVDVQNIIAEHRKSSKAATAREKQKTVKALLDRLFQEL